MPHHKGPERYGIHMFFFHIIPVADLYELFSDNFPTIFSHRADNEANQDDMQKALEIFYYEIAEIPKDRIKAVQRSVNRMLELVMPRLRRNRFAFRFANPILSDPLFENLKTISGLLNKIFVLISLKEQVQRTCSVVIIEQN